MLFIIDFDGTLSVRDTVDEMLDRFAAPEWKDVERDWLDGRITAVECMRRQVRMVRTDRITLEGFFRTIELNAGFPAFFDHVSAYAAVAIVSDGLDHAIGVALKQAAFPNLPVYANKLHFLPRGLDISYPHRNPICRSGNGVCKCAVAQRLNGTSGSIVLVGDGKSDACLARSADAVFAKGSLAEFCHGQGIAHYRFEDFHDVLSVVRRWKAPRSTGTVPARHG